MKRFIIAAILLFCTQITFAGSVHPLKWLPFPPGVSGHITGTVIDSVNKQPVEFATVSVFPDGSAKPIDGTSTNNKGYFKIDNLAEGKYTVSISFLGYRTKIRRNIIISSANGTMNLGNLFLRDNSVALKGVTVTSQRDLIENRIDKMVFNADKDISSQSGVATDVLRKVPQVAVDVDGNVELRGSTNVRVLINGKPSTILATSLADALQSIPANQIKSIEVITNPSAKYDAEGTAGIINIVLKKSTAKGVSGSVNTTLGTRFENGSFNINARKGTFGINAGISGNDVIPSTSTTSSTKVNTDSLNRQVIINQNGSGKIRRNGYNGRFGIDWDLSPKDNLTSTLSFNDFGFMNTGLTAQNTLFPAGYTGFSRGPASLFRNSSSDFRVKGLDWTTDFKRTFNDRGREINISYQLSNSNSLNNYTQNQTAQGALTPFNGQLGNNKGDSREQNIQVDYTEPVSKSTKLELGTKAVIRDISSNTLVNSLNASKNYVFSPSLSDRFNYKQNIFAAYAVLSFKAFNYLDFYTGLRIENTRNHGSFAGTSLSLPSYTSYIPSFTVSRTISPTQTIKIAYTQRIQRPGLRDLNPFVNASDPTSLTTGNPDLGPEHTKSIELSYNVFLGKGSSINTSAYYRYTTNDIQNYTTRYPVYTVGDSIYHNVQVSMNENIGRQRLYGLNIFGSVPVTPKFTLRANVNVFKDYEQNVQLASQNINSFNYRLNANASYNFTSTLSGEFFGFVNSPRRTVQGSSPSFSIYNLGIRQQLWKKKGSIALTASAPFSKYHDFHTNISGPGFTQVSDRNVPLRSFGINFSYAFGKINYTSKSGSKTSENDVHEDDASGGLGGAGGSGGGGGASGGGVRPAGGGGRPAGAQPAGGKPSGIQPAGAQPAYGQPSGTAYPGRGTGGFHRPGMRDSSAAPKAGIPDSATSRKPVGGASAQPVAVSDSALDRPAMKPGSSPQPADSSQHSPALPPAKIQPCATGLRKEMICKGSTATGSIPLREIKEI